MTTPNCSNNHCPVADNCWTYGKPPELDKYRKPIEVCHVPERDDEIEFKCKMFTKYPNDED